MVKFRRAGNSLLTLAVLGAALTAAICDCKVVLPGVTVNPPVITDQSSCAAACNHMASLECEEAEPINMGTACHVDVDCKNVDGMSDPSQTCSPTGTCTTSCTNFCIAIENQGVWLDPECVAKITSCNQISTCPAPQPQGSTSCTGSACKVAPTTGR